MITYSKKPQFYSQLSCAKPIVSISFGWRHNICIFFLMEELEKKEAKYTHFQSRKQWKLPWRWRVSGWVRKSSQRRDSFLPGTTKPFAESFALAPQFYVGLGVRFLPAEMGTRLQDKHVWAQRQVWHVTLHTPPRAKQHADTFLCLPPSDFKK